jgi:hypothetical protein
MTEEDDVLVLLEAVEDDPQQCEERNGHEDGHELVAEAQNLVRRAWLVERVDDAIDKDKDEECAGPAGRTQEAPLSACRACPHVVGAPRTSKASGDLPFTEIRRLATHKNTRTGATNWGAGLGQRGGDLT